jgi:predicted nucleic acid-binding protein
MPAIRRNFHDILEPIVYIDSTVAIAAEDNHERFHTECKAFCQRIEPESTLLVVSDFVYNEVAFHHIKSALADEGRRQGKSWMWVKHNLPHVFDEAMINVQISRAEWEHTTLKLSITDSVMARAFQLMQDFHLLPTDAFHIATALESNVNVFATLDKDFLAVDSIIVYTCVPLANLSAFRDVD